MARVYYDRLKGLSLSDMAGHGLKYRQRAAADRAYAEYRVNLKVNHVRETESLCAYDNP